VKYSGNRNKRLQIREIRMKVVGGKNIWGDIGWPGMGVRGRPSMETDGSA